MVTNPIKLNNVDIQFTVTAEHVGIMRSTAGITTTIYTCITEHKKALRAVMHTGMARRHRSNPAASLSVANLYGLPVLLSGLAPLVMNKSEEIIIEQHHKENISNLQRLLPCTPTPVVCFLAGSLPGSAHLHLRKLTIFGMICRLPATPCTTMLSASLNLASPHLSLGSGKFLICVRNTAYHRQCSF